MSRTWLKRCTLAALSVAAVALSSCSERPKESTAPVVATPSADITGYSSAAGYNFMVNGAQWTSGYDVPTSVGTGVIRPFLDMQTSPIEQGFNTDNDNFQYDQHRTSDTNALPVNYVPVLNEMIGGVSTPVREFVLDAHESDGYFNIDEFKVYLCTTDAARTYSLWTDVTGASTCQPVYSIAGANPAPPINATDQFSSGSGNTFDYRILIPNSMFAAAAGGTPLCAYDPSAAAEAACHQYILVWSKMSDVGSTFEEFSTILRPAIKVVKTPDAGTVNAGNDITFTMVVSSSGSGTATGVTLSDPLPMGTGGVNWYNATATAGTCNITGIAPAQQTLNCTLGDLAQGASITVTATAHTTQTACAVYNNTATVNSTNAGSANDAGQITVQNCTGTIVIEKVTTGGYGGAFPYTTTGGLSPSTFNLTTTAAGTAGKATQTYSNVLAGSYSVTEGTMPTGFEFTSLSCSTGGSVSGQTANITLVPGATVTCTYTNTKQGSIVIEKVTTGGFGGPFPYTATGTGLSSFNLTTTAAGTAGKDTKTFSNLSPGSYSVTEGTMPTGFEFTSLNCSTGGSVSSQTANITLAAGATVTCTYTNTKQGSIVIEKVTTGGFGGPFPYTTTGTGLSSFNLTTTAAGTAGKDTKTFSNLSPGSYSVTEGTLPAGFEFTSLSCSAGGSVSSETANITLAAGATVTCTYTNTKQAILRIAKATDPDGSAVEFTFTPTGGWNGGSTFTRHDNQAAFASDYLSPGTYGATETVPTDWALTGRTCVNTTGGSAHGFTSPTNGVSVTLAAGEDVTCTFTDQRLAVLVVQKEIPGTNSTIFEFTRGTMPAGVTSAFSLGDGANSGTGRTLSPGTYSVCETPWAGWQDPTAQTSINSGALGASVTGTYNAGTNAFCWSVNIAAGDSAYVLVTNTQPPGTTRTIGYWKNWTSCDGKGNQWAKALADDAYAGTLDANLPQTIGLLVLDKDPAGPDGQAADCTQAVDILSKSSIDGTKRPGDAAYNLAAQLLGAKLNITAGSGSCTTADNAIGDAQTLLAGISFKGLGWYLTSKVGDPATATQANALAAILDSFNNGTLGGGCPTHAP